MISLLISAAQLEAGNKEDQGHRGETYRPVVA